MVIFQSVFRFSVLYTTKNLSKRKLSEISEFSILGIGQNRKLGNLGNFYFFSLSFILKVHFLFEVIFWFLDFEFLILPKIKVNKNFPIFQKFSISGIGHNRKLGNLGNFIYLFFKVLFPIVFYLEFLLVKRSEKNPPKKHRNLGNFNPRSLMGYSSKMETKLIILILIGEKIF